MPPAAALLPPSAWPLNATCCFWTCKLTPVISGLSKILQGPHTLFYFILRSIEDSQGEAAELCRSFPINIFSQIDKVESSRPALFNIAQSSGTHSYGGPVSRLGLVLEA
jgi:hypothetical protein